jgi:hypothetical protein
VPYYYLGKALFNMGDCIGALQAWQNSIDQGQVQQLAAEYADLQQEMTSCQPETIDVSTIAAAATDELEILDAANARFSALASDADLATEWNSEWKPRLDASVNYSRRLRQTLATAVDATDEDGITGVLADARLAANEVDLNITAAQDRAAALRRNEAERLAAAAEQEEILRQQREAEEQTRQQNEQAEREQRVVAQRDLQRAMDEAEVILQDSTGQEASGEQRTSLAALVAAGRALTLDDTAARMQQQAQDIADGSFRVRLAVQDWQARVDEEARRTPTPQLKQVADAYFNGNYQEVVDLVDPADFDENSEKIQVILFRSAALFNLFTLSGGSENALLDDAKRDIRLIKSLDGRFSPYVAAFSPKYLSLFSDTG